MENGKPLLGATLIVKDESAVIAKTLQSIAEFVDVVTVVDTGSTDDTLLIVQRILRKIPLTIVQEAFVDYASARNRALEAAGDRPTVFTLTLSADETLHGGQALREFLEYKRDTEEGAFCVMLQSGPRQWPFPRILRTGGGWKYVNTAGARHEQPVGPNGELDAALVPIVRVLHEESDPTRKHKRLREKDLPDLTAVVEDESKPLDDRAEAMFQLAETHFVLGQIEPTGDDGKPIPGGRWRMHKFMSMANYTRYAEIAQDEKSKVYNPQRASYAWLMYVYVGETFGLFEPSEMVKRLSVIAQAAPMLPEVHWLLAKNAFYLDPKKAMNLALKAAKVARFVYDHPVHGATDVTLEWQAYRLASACAKEVKDRRLQHEFAQKALVAGAPSKTMEGLVELS